MRWHGCADSEDTGPRPCARRGSSCSLTQGMARSAGDVPVPECRQCGEPRPSRCRGWTVVGGSADVSPEATGARKRIAEARREQLVFVRRFRGYRDPHKTLHVVLSLEQGLGSTVQYGRQSWA